MYFAAYKPLDFMKLLVKKIKEDGITDIAAQIAYYFLLSLFPFLLFIFALLPYFPIESVEVISFIDQYFPGGSGDLIDNHIQYILNRPQGGLLSFGIIATLWTASNAINTIIRSLNIAYNKAETRTFIISKLLSIVLTITMVFVIVITLLLPVFGQLIITAIQKLFYLPEVSSAFLQLLRWGIGFSVMAVVLMMLYKIAPCKKIKINEVFWGAVIVTLCWQLISLGFSYYVNNFGNFSATYGALGGVIVLMIWFYLSGLLLLLGGVINSTLAELKNNKKPANDYQHRYR